MTSFQAQDVPQKEKSEYNVANFYIKLKRRQNRYYIVVKPIQREGFVLGVAKWMD